MYFDWLKNVQANRKAAEKVLAFLTADSPEGVSRVPEVRNYYVQRSGSNDCGLVVWYVLELLMKRHRGEGDHTLLPDPITWRKKLHQFLVKLRQQQGQWALEVA